MATPESPSPSDQMSTNAWRDREMIIARFEDAWDRGTVPAVRDFLPDDPNRCRPVLVELVHIDLERRLKRGEPARVESYLQAFPDLAGDAQTFLSLLQAEHELRRRWEKDFTPVEYLQRFPEHREALWNLFQLDGETVSQAACEATPAAQRPSPQPPAADPYATAPPGQRPPPPSIPADPYRTVPPAPEGATVSVQRAPDSPGSPRTDPALEGWVDEVKRLRLLPPEHLYELPDLARRFGSTPALSQELVRREWLTPFQLTRIAEGKGAELVLDTYVLLDLLGQGGMGSVYKARQVRMKRVVALKTIKRTALASPEMAERFRREGEAAARLSHPNVVTVYDANEAGGVLYLVMEYLEGADLARLVKQRGPLPVDQACDYARQAALGLQHIHEQGLVHRDVKPHNLMLTKQGVVKVMDLGLARLAGEPAAGLTATGAAVGTPDYIAPEQALNAKAVDIRADVYSLGCSLYHLLAGQVPFPEGALTEKLMYHQLRTPAAIEQLRGGLPPGLPDVVRKMMAKRPEQRYQLPREVAVALAPFCPAPGNNPAFPPLPSPVSGSPGPGASSLPTTAPVAPQATATAPQGITAPAAGSPWDGFVVRGILRGSLLRLARGAVWLLPVAVLAWVTNGFKITYWVEYNGVRIHFLMVIAAGFAVRAAWAMAPGLPWLVYPPGHPAIRGLKKYGPPGDVLRSIEAELADDKQRTAVGPALVTNAWLVSRDPYGVSIAHLPDVTYAVLTREGTDKPKLGVTLRRRLSADVFIDCRGRDVDARCLLNEIAHRAPWVTIA